MPSIFTIGYEGTDIETFVAVLRAEEIECLIDVRAVPHSRKRGFSKKTLAGRLEIEGIEYVHLVALGDPKLGREAAKAGKHDLFEQIYRRHLATEEAQKALHQATQIALARSSCLMCFERDADACHRSIVATALSLTGIGVCNLNNDLPRYYGHFPEQSRHTGQSIAAAE